VPLGSASFLYVISKVLFIFILTPCVKQSWAVKLHEALYFTLWPFFSLERIILVEYPFDDYIDFHSQ
jgi:hypothetical protein